MKIRDLAIVLLLAGAAIFFAVRAIQNKEFGGESGKNEHDRPASGRVSGGTGEEEENGVVRSARKLKPGRRVVTTGSGLQYEVLKKGVGKNPGPDSRVQVHYVGLLEDGSVFDSSRGREVPSTFSLNGVIKGWTEGLQLMKPGAIYRLVIPSELAYGQNGAGEIVPPDSTLTFEVELISIEEP